MQRRIYGFYKRFLEAHPKQDLDRARVSLVVKKLDKQLALSPAPILQIKRTDTFGIGSFASTTQFEEISLKMNSGSAQVQRR